MLKDSSIFTFPSLPCCHCKELLVVNILLLQTLEVKKRKENSQMPIGNQEKTLGKAHKKNQKQPFVCTASWQSSYRVLCPFGGGGKH